MKVIVTGGAGFIGRRLAKALLDRETLIGGDDQPARIDRLVVADVIAPDPGISEDPRLEVRVGDIGEPDFVRGLVDDDTGLVFHLAAVVSGGAEADFDLGMRVNLESSRHLLEAVRHLAQPARLVFASSVAVYGGDMPDVIEDSTALTPQTSYGIQKAVTELLINDYSRKGFLDGRSLRLPTIVVRPGKPNKAASSFASNILREPLEGRETNCPVGRETGVWVLSPRRVVENFIHAAELPAETWGSNRGVALPGMTVSVAEMVDALGRIGGEGVASRINWQPDPYIEKIVYGWATRFAPRRAEAMGFSADASIDEIIRAFIDDELGGQFVA